MGNKLLCAPETNRTPLEPHRPFQRGLCGRTAQSTGVPHCPPVARPVFLQCFSMLSDQETDLHSCLPRNLTWTVQTELVEMGKVC